MRILEIIFNTTGVIINLLALIFNTVRTINLVGAGHLTSSGNLYFLPISILINSVCLIVCTKRFIRDGGFSGIH